MRKKNHLHSPMGALTVCPWNVLMGLSCPSLQTWMHMSVLQEANVLLLCQSTSSAGAVIHTHKETLRHEEESCSLCQTRTVNMCLYLNGRETVVWLLLCERPI